MTDAKKEISRVFCSLLLAAGLGSSQASFANQALIKIKDMSCAACVKTVKKSLSSVPEVGNADVESGVARVSSQGGKQLDAASLKAAVEKAGYVVEDVKITP